MKHESFDMIFNDPIATYTYQASRQLESKHYATFQVSILVTPNVVPFKMKSYYSYLKLFKALIYMYVMLVYHRLIYNYRVKGVFEIVMNRENFNLINSPREF